MDDDRIPAVDVKAVRLDASTFGLVYQAHRLSVYRYLRARTRTDAEALDLAADTFERAFTNLDRFRARDGGVRAWLLRIARNAAIDAHRRRRPTVEMTEANVQSNRIAVEADRMEGEHVEEPGILVDRLPRDQGDALLLRYASGLTARGDRRRHRQARGRRTEAD